MYDNAGEHEITKMTPNKPSKLGDLKHIPFSAESNRAQVSMRTKKPDRNKHFRSQKTNVLLPKIVQYKCRSFHTAVVGF